ncbi:MAG TPA: 5'/3'-nucleotidase SurE [Levilinea sp.]|nr:5'/3'-nucleotidase SurE [Levilinea sp.]
MRILIANDDGIFSPGLVALAEVAEKFGEVMIMAPDVEQSAMGHAITIQRPLRYIKTRLQQFNAYRVNGTPADCVAIGMYHWGMPDLVLTGINLGSNLGNDIWHSGTVAAAKQANLLGAPAVAFSTHVNGIEPDFTALKPYIAKVLEMALDDLDWPMLVNVNLPQAPVGMMWTHQSVRHYNGKVVEGEDPMGRKHYWFAAIPLTEPDEGSDRWAMEHDLVSLTPLRLDLTDEGWLQRVIQKDEIC